MVAFASGDPASRERPMRLWSIDSGTNHKVVDGMRMAVRSIEKILLFYIHLCLERNRGEQWLCIEQIETIMEKVSKHLARRAT